MRSCAASWKAAEKQVCTLGVKNYPIEVTNGVRAVSGFKKVHPIAPFFNYF